LGVAIAEYAQPCYHRKTSKPMQKTHNAHLH
jgi:hypothetical protein